MRIPSVVFSLLLAVASPAWGLVLADPAASTSSSQPLLNQWLAELDTSAIVRIHTPYGVTASGVLLKGGTHVLTAAHVTRCIHPQKIQNGLVDFSNAKGQRRHWKSLITHPAAKTAAHLRIWDASLIELSEAIPEDEIQGLSIAEDDLTPGQLIAFTGFGHQGNGQLGAFQTTAHFSLGFNHLDSRLTASQCARFHLPVGDWPLWVHDFDDKGELHSQEAHFASGDSGGAGLILDAQGRTRLLSLNIARHRGNHDSDHRLNGSFGELGLSLEVRALLPWLRSSLSVNQGKQNEISKKTATKER